MALTVLSAIPEAASLDIRILATDLNPHVVAHGKGGCYRKEELGDVPPNMRAKWFEASPGDGREAMMKVDEEVRSLVSFRQLNLMGPWPFGGPFDAIFCRNVVIYFDRETQNTIWGSVGAADPRRRRTLYRAFRARRRTRHRCPVERWNNELSQESGRGIMKKVKVLVVDDSSTMRGLIATALSNDPDIEVVGEAEDPVEARQAIKALNPDVITLDVEMPNMNGIDFLEKIMRLRRCPSSWSRP